MPGHAQGERRALADLLDEVGPHAPTLCAGWSAADLAAHLVVRERRPDAAAGILAPPLAGYTARVQRRIRDGRPWADLVEAVRSGPPLPLRVADEAVNTVEYFVHHEDVRRARPGWEPRTLSPELSAALWSRLRVFAPVLFRRAGVGVELVAPGLGSRRARRRQPTVRAEGEPGELVLLGYGRGDHVRVDLAGDAEAVDRLRHARLGL